MFIYIEFYAFGLFIEEIQFFTNRDDAINYRESKGYNKCGYVHYRDEELYFKDKIDKEFVDKSKWIIIYQLDNKLRNTKNDK